MRKRFFQSICLACFITLLLTTFCIVSVIYNYSTKELKKEVINHALFISKALELVDHQNNKYLTEIGKESENRITLITSNGTVIFDNNVPTDSLTNHINRPEIQSAILNGKGEITRHSDTLGEGTYYYAVKLDNGNILRVACTIKSVFGLIKSTVIWIAFIALFILLFSIIIANLITKSIVRPINNLNLNQPLSNDTYEELSPLLIRMEKQSQLISQQLNELSLQQQEFDYITDAMNEGLIIFSEKGVILSANKGAKSLLNTANVVGKSYLQLLRDINYIKAIETAMSGKSLSVKMKKDGRIYQLSSNPVKVESDSCAGVLLFFDITDKEQAEKIRREFSANVSHELKTPLTSIMGYAEIIENGIANNGDIQRFANQINVEAARLLTLIEDIISLSRLDESDLQQVFEDVELSNLCKTIINELTKKANTKEVNVNFEGPPLIVRGIKPILYELIFNLCDNSITYNNQNGTVSVKLLKENNKVKLLVSDTGIGVALEHQNRIFERFYRVDKSHSKSTGGTGLGLSIVKHAALIHQAEIAFESQVNVGTTVTITFN